MVAAQLEKRLGEVEKKADRAARTAKEGADMAIVTSSVLVALQVLDGKEELTAVVDRTIGQLEALSRQFPQDRALHIVLARLFAEKKNDKDKAIACYLSLKLAEETHPEKKARLAAEGTKALAERLAIAPGNLQDAKTDPELSALRATNATETPS